ncbi:MAG TPA: S41 family peptidase [Gemmatimonadaceae bacterium]|nr:S41 family peptidase [Gemmatimonadaceae bacterium]
MKPVRFALALITATALQGSAQSLDGTWRSDGYGWVFDIRGDSLRAREVTAVSCLPSFRAHRVTAPSGAVAAFMFDGAPVTVQVLGSSSTDVMRLHLEGSASDYFIRRVSAAPAVCDQETPKDAQTTFDVLWHNYAEHYPFFALKKVDWNAVRAKYRPRTANASPAELFEIFREMVEPLHDAHTYIVANDINRRMGGTRPDSHSIGASGRTRVAEIITSKYLRTPLRTWAQGRVSFGYLPDSIGYMRITGFAGYTQDGSFRSALAALEAALDTIFADTRGWRGLVIDVRINGGGADPLGLAIASRLTATPYVAYAKVARSDPRDPTKMTERQVSTVTPSNRPGWRGPVVELTSRYSVSAAETFTQALMGRRPAIARVGEHTQGVFSDVLSRSLPNGWRIGLPNELFLTEQGTSFDGPGIPPTVPVPTFTRADLEAGRDPGLERAIQLLKTP